MAVVATPNINKGKPVVIAVDCRTRFSITLTGFKQGNKNDFELF